MDINIDIKELSIRESERVEWKENGDDIDVVKKIVKTICAFSNDISNLGGGYVICGAKEGKDEHGFPKVIYTGLSSSKLKEIEGKVLQFCRDYVSPPIVPLVNEIENPIDNSTRILVFTVLASSDAHIFRDGQSSNYYVRISRETREARNGVLTQLLIKKQKIEYFDKRVNLKADETDIDLIVLRDYLIEMGLYSQDKSLEDYISDKTQIAEFIPPLFTKTQLDGQLRPKNFTLLLFGKKQSITSYYSEAYTVLSIYKGKDRSEPTAERYLLTGNIVEQAKKSIELLNTQAYTAFDKTNSRPNQVKYPIRALQEAVINAIVHRDYEIPEPNRITVFSDRIEIRSSGSLHWSIDKEEFINGKASPKWRNQCFAYIFNKLQLSQSEGQGIPTIYRTMKDEGCPRPIINVEQENIVCIIPAHPRHQIIREIQEIQDKIIQEKYHEAKEQTIELLKNDLYNSKLIETYCLIVNKLECQYELFNWIKDNPIDLSLLVPSTVIQIVDTLLSSYDNKQFYQISKKAIFVVFKELNEDSTIIKAIKNLKKVGEPEEVIKYVSEAFVKFPNLINNSTLLEKRATSKMDLAKKCINTAKDKLSSPKTKARAWEKCKELLDEAEKDLFKAIDNVDNPYEKEFIEKDINFLNDMKKISRKPIR